MGAGLREIENQHTVREGLTVARESEHGQAAVVLPTFCYPHAAPSIHDQRQFVLDGGGWAENTRRRSAKTRNNLVDDADSVGSGDLRHKEGLLLNSCFRDG